MESLIEVCGLAKTFMLFNQEGARIPVFEKLDLTVHAGECVALYGPSGCGKSSLLRSLYANYKPQKGEILVRHREVRIDMVKAEPSTVLAVRRETIGFVSQFLRVIPRIPTLETVAEPLRALGIDAEVARRRAVDLLCRLNIPEGLWSLAPATFSGGEQQRVNIARGFVVDYPIILLDEPTAALDDDNRQGVVKLILEAKKRGAGLVGIFHDDEVRESVADRIIDLRDFATTL